MPMSTEDDRPSKHRSALLPNNGIFKYYHSNSSNCTFFMDILNEKKPMSHGLERN